MVSVCPERLLRREKKIAKESLLKYAPSARHKALLGGPEIYKEGAGEDRGERVSEVAESSNGQSWVVSFFEDCT